MSSEFSADRLWLVHLRKFGETGKGDLAPYLSAQLAGTLIADALKCGVSLVRTQVSSDGWFVLSSDTEWLQINLPAQMPSRELFSRLVPWPGEAERTRHEIHVATAARDVFLGRHGALESVKGELPPRPVQASIKECAFAIGFRLVQRA